MTDDPTGKAESSDFYREKADMLARALEDFSYAVSHDLHAPLRQAKSFIQLLLKDLEPHMEPAHHTYKGLIFQAVDDMNRDLDILLSYSRLSRTDPIYETINPAALIRDKVIPQLGPIIEESGAAIEINALPPLSGDRNMLANLFFCLLDNALKFRSPARRLQIVISGTQENSAAVKITTTDNGIGIPADKTEDVFTMFHTLHSPDDYPGRGAGLAFARNIAMLHNGQLSLTSAGPDQGTKAILILPAKTTEPE